MAESALAIGVSRILAAESVVAMLSGPEAVTPVVPAPEVTGPAITVNRLFERCDDGETVVGLAITCFAKSVQEIEDIGAALVDEIDGTNDFAFGDLVDITFDKAGADVTGCDERRGLLLRQIEFAVTY